MGWLYGWSSKQQLVDHLNRGLVDDYKLITNCVRGNCHWQVIEHKSGKRYIALNLLQSYDGEWGYKDMDESVGPCYYNCPLSYLDLAPETEDTGQYAKQWRQSVREYHAQRKPKAKLVVGQEWALKNTRYPITVKLIKLKPLLGRDTHSGQIYRVPRKLLGNLKEGDTAL